MGDRPAVGYRSVPHTADARIEAWAPTREQCVAEAITALVAGFAAVPEAVPTSQVEFTVEPGADDDMLVSVLDEVIYRLDTTGQLPVQAEVQVVEGGGLEVRLLMTDTDRVDVVGAVPKAVSLHELRFAHEAGGWSCAVTVDV